MINGGNLLFHLFVLCFSVCMLLCYVYVCLSLSLSLALSLSLCIYIYIHIYVKYVVLLYFKPSTSINIATQLKGGNLAELVVYICLYRCVRIYIYIYICIEGSYLAELVAVAECPDEGPLQAEADQHL